MSDDVRMNASTTAPLPGRLRYQLLVVIWAEWHYGEEFLPPSRGGQDHLDYYGVEFRDPSDLEQWPHYMNGDVEPESDEFVRWANTHIWHEFDTWEEAERWFEGDDEDSLHLRRGE